MIPRHRRTATAATAAAGQSVDRARFGFVAAVPLPRRWARAKTWAGRWPVQPSPSLAFSTMRHLERLNRG